MYLDCHQFNFVRFVHKQYSLQLYRFAQKYHTRVRFKIVLQKFDACYEPFFNFRFKTSKLK